VSSWTMLQDFCYADWQNASFAAVLGRPYEWRANAYAFNRVRPSVCVTPSRKICQFRSPI